ncbi:hypothetical protein [Rothia aerolata]|uniref:Uncharacterized protein n=1 Tax=Rothia aerolata TaxID=1812262 RepID=A0A917MUZ4_9MICC|nr:hypothetical protein [Rothia aerolata]GGH65737.1 hypothetical protein GCM10007359_19280 [Rothia aerolata]
MIKKTLEFLFVICFGLSLIGGIVIVLGQTLGIAIANVPMLTYLGSSFVIPVCILASISAICAFLLSYTRKDVENNA